MSGECFGNERFDWTIVHVLFADDQWKRSFQFMFTLHVIAQKCQNWRKDLLREWCWLNKVVLECGFCRKLLRWQYVIGFYWDFVYADTWNTHFNDLTVVHAKLCSYPLDADLIEVQKFVSRILK